MKDLLHNYIYFTHVITVKKLHLYFVLKINIVHLPIKPSFHLTL